MAARDECQRLLDEASELLTPSQQDWLLLQLIKKTPSHRLQPLHAEIQRILSFDLVSRLPYMVAERIFSYLDTIALCAAAQCCKKWRELANNDRLWYELCKARGYDYCDNLSLSDWEEGRRPTSPRKKMYDVSNMGSHFPPSPCHWKQVYIKGEVLNCNWRHGVYNMTTQRGHQTTITSMAVEGNLLVSGSRDKTVRVWNIQSLNCVHVLSQHTDEVNCVQIKDNLIFSGSSDGCVRVFDASSGQCLWCLDTHSGAVELLTYQSGWIVSANSDYSLHIWEFVSGQPVHQHVLHGHTMSVTCLQVCSDGTVVSGSWDSSLRIWQSDSGVCGRVLRAHAEGVYCLQCDINKIVSGGGDNMVALWDTKTGQSLRSFAGHTQEILCVKYNEHLIASCSADSTIRLWEINGNCIHLLEDHIGLVRCLHLSENRLVSAGDRKKVNIWCTKDGSLLHTVHRQQTLVHLLCVTNTKIITGPPDTGIISIASYW